MSNEKRLKDITKNGKERPWRTKKLANLTYGEYLLTLNYRKASNVKSCGSVLNFKRTSSGRLKLYQTWFCKSRLCPLCAWRRAMKNSNQLLQILTEVHKEYPKGRFLFLTLTAKNVTSDNLKSSVSALGTAFNKLVKYKKVGKNILGYVRSTEITVNHTSGTYHPHMHVLLFVSSNYFVNSDNYLSQSDWTKYWQKALKVSYTPVVNIQAIHPKKDKTDLMASAKETAKYQVKSSDYITDNVDEDLQVTEDLEQALSHTRAISYGKLFKTIRKKLQLEDEDDLINTDDQDNDEPLTNAELVIAKWNYQRKNYYIQ